MKSLITCCRTSFGWVSIAVSEDSILALSLPAPTRAKAETSLDQYRGPEHASEPLFLAGLKEDLQRYFEGLPVDFEHYPLANAGTAFQRRVWAITRTIPRGETRSYGWIARQLGNLGWARAVGQALAANPWPVIVPCHRVVGAGGRLTGFGGGLGMKARLLMLEGAITLSR